MATLRSYGIAPPLILEALRRECLFVGVREDVPEVYGIAERRFAGKRGENHHTRLKTASLRKQKFRAFRTEPCLFTLSEPAYGMVVRKCTENYPIFQAKSYHRTLPVQGKWNPRTGEFTLKVKTNSLPKGFNFSPPQSIHHPHQCQCHLANSASRMKRLRA